MVRDTPTGRNEGWEREKKGRWEVMGGGSRVEKGALLHQRDSQQFTAGDGEKRDSPAGERKRKRKEAEWGEHAWNGN